MPSACHVCVRLDRAAIDERLQSQQCNVAALARELGVPRRSLSAHRENHIPTFLDAFSARAENMTIAQLNAEAQRRYRIALDALALAEAGTLQQMLSKDPDTGEMVYSYVRKRSPTAIARLIREARAEATHLASLAAVRADAEGRIEQQANIDLGAAIREQLERTVARRAALSSPTFDGVEVVDAEIVDRVGGDGNEQGVAVSVGVSTGGAPTVSTARLAASSFPTFSDKPQKKVETPPANPEESTSQLTEQQLRTAATALGITAEAFAQAINHRRQAYEVHPEWKGNPAATKEERLAEGYGDVPVQDHRWD